MKRRELWSVLLGTSVLAVLAGCMSRIGESAGDTSLGEPYRCSRCGYLTRSKTDLTGERCPRCYSKKLKKISEEEMAKLLAAG